jgi:tRNA nucleotidyltransferase (CCA-adding enzyme)
MTQIVKCGIAPYIGLPDEANLVGFQKIWNNRIENVDYHPVTLLCGLLHTPEDALALHDRLKLSAYDRDLAYFLARCKEDTKEFHELM